MRIAVVTEIPAPFRIPLFNALAAHPSADLEVLFLADQDPRRRHYPVYEREFAFPWRVLPGRSLERGGRWLVWSRGVERELRRFRPHAIVVGGWNQPAFWRALLHARLHRRALVAWVESTARDERAEAKPLALARRAFVRSCAGFVVPGRASAEYVRSLRPEAEIAVAPNAVDAAIFSTANVDRRGREQCTFLYVGRLEREKGLDVLLRAFDAVPGRLVLVGRGDDEGRLRRLAGDRVQFVGALERDDLPELYAAADVFVLPSLSEPWGMVLNEAAAAGLPLVATDAAGAAHELIDEGQNGFMVPAGDEGALAGALRRLASDETLRMAAGAHSRVVADRFVPEAWANAVVGLVERVTRNGPTILTGPE